MQEFDPSLFSNLYRYKSRSHKGENGKLLVVGGSHLFHAAPLWVLEVASRICDLVFFSSVQENNEIVLDIKSQFRNGIVISRSELPSYIEESDCVLAGPGMLRREAPIEEFQELSLEEIFSLTDEGLQSYYFAHYLLTQYPEKRVVLDAGALQMLDLRWLSGRSATPILTPHRGEFVRVFSEICDAEESWEKRVEQASAQHKCVIILKGEQDIVCEDSRCFSVRGGNVGMTKGGTGDVLAGVAASLYTKNDAFLSAACASYINKRAGDSLFSMVGPFFNASDLAGEIPHVMNELLGYSATIS